MAGDGSGIFFENDSGNLAKADPRIVAVRFLRNFGQHNANLAGFAEARGTWIVTMDDDGQNPAEEIAHLVAATEDGEHDVVFGRFDRKKASSSRSLGSKLMGAMNRRIFGKPKDLTVSNFRLLHRDVVRGFVYDVDTHRLREIVVDDG